MNNKKIIYIIIFVILFTLSSYIHAVSYIVSNYSSVYYVGSDITLNVKGEDIIGKISITSSNSNVISVSKEYDWLDGNINIKLKAKAKGNATITIKSVDTSNSKTGKEVNISKSIKIYVTDMGDLNEDKKIDVTDAYIILSKIANNKVIDKKNISDINEDGKVDVTDAYMLLNIISKTQI